MEWNDYVYENGVLKNKFDIRDEKLLLQKESEIVLTKLSALILTGLEGNFDINHLKRIHKYLFGEIYDFAGEFRQVEIYKPKSDIVFSKYVNIEEELSKIMEEANRLKNLKVNFETAMFLGNFYYKLIMIHPFREGNGRTIREFLREFVSSKIPGYELDYSKVNKQNFLLGITDYETYPNLLAYEIYNSLVPIDVKSK